MISHQSADFIWYKSEPYSISQEICTRFVVLCFVVVMQSFIMNSHEVFIHIHQGCFTGTGAIVRLPQCQWSKPEEYGKISQCITTTKHSKAKTVCIFLGIYCTCRIHITWLKTNEVAHCRNPSCFSHVAQTKRTSQVRYCVVQCADQVSPMRRKFWYCSRALPWDWYYQTRKYILLLTHTYHWPKEYLLQKKSWISTPLGTMYSRC